MTPATQPQTKPHPRRGGWTAERRRQFLDALAAGLDVRRACARVGLSRQSAYRLRAREADFARAWDNARDAARAAEERAFRATVVQMFPALAERLGEGAARGSGFLPLDSVTSGPCV